MAFYLQKQDRQQQEQQTIAQSLHHVAVMMTTKLR